MLSFFPNSRRWCFEDTGSRISHLYLSASYLHCFWALSYTATSLPLGVGGAKVLVAGVASRPYLRATQHPLYQHHVSSEHTATSLPLGEGVAKVLVAGGASRPSLLATQHPLYQHHVSSELHSYLLTSRRGWSEGTGSRRSLQSLSASYPASSVPASRGCLVIIRN